MRSVGMCILGLVGDPLIPIVFGAVCYGCFTLLLIFSLRILLESRSRTRAKLVLAAVIVVMHAAATAHLVVVLVYARLWYRTHGDGSPPANTSTLRLTTRLQLVINFLPAASWYLGDLIVVWRAWLLWGRKVRISLAVGSMICTIVAPIVYSWNECEGQIISYVLMMVMNAYGVILIGIKAWLHRRLVHSQRDEVTMKTTSERVLLMLTESGALYNSAWLLFSVGRYTPVPGLNDVMMVSMVQLSGIYPSLVVVLADRHKDISEEYWLPTSPMCFATPEVSDDMEQCIEPPRRVSAG
ncbi:hypothetical protein EVG20_g5338 [Dentipellis fragilis]|uniref:Uncharacterized protein n=1 Tax=Dentipellis fragilis TaxID=205917 RepID=A0A4Y9YVY7_9AGAM|nr:hypothetical protein EVG20_g5338 [Dentipellis fragilis]